MTKRKKTNAQASRKAGPAEGAAAPENSQGTPVAVAGSDQGTGQSADGIRPPADRPGGEGGPAQSLQGDSASGAGGELGEGTLSSAQGGDNASTSGNSVGDAGGNGGLTDGEGQSIAHEVATGTASGASAEGEDAATADPANQGLLWGSDDEREICISCDFPLLPGQLVHHGVDGGYIHAACCLLNPGQFVGPDGSPLQEGDQLPEPFEYGGEHVDAGGSEGDSGSISERVSGLGTDLGDGSAGDQSPPDIGEGSAGISGGSEDEHLEDGEPVEPSPEDFNLFCASRVLSAVTCGADDVTWLLDRATWEKSEYVPFDSAAVVGELGRFVREIRERATPQVLAHQLVIKGHRASADITRPEEIALRIFASTLLELDAFANEERRRIEATAVVAEERPPVPIEDTSLETISGTFDTTL